jgi:hypothetical protein
MHTGLPHIASFSDTMEAAATKDKATTKGKQKSSM